MELERFLENQTEMLGNLTITDSICIDTLRDICERYYELKKLRVADVSRRSELLAAFIDWLIDNPERFKPNKPSIMLADEFLKSRK